ncbi:MAG: glycosyltransferase family 2 protein [Patescibacteria group bacterium]
MPKSEDTTPQPLVSIVVLNWHGTEDTLRCVSSVNELDYANIQLVVVDNEFSSDSREKLETIAVKGSKSNYSYVPLVANAGFTGGEIEGLKHCSGDYILILNNDATIEPGAVRQMLRTFATDTMIAAVGGRSYLLDDNGNKMGIAHYTHQRVDPVSAEVTTYSQDDGSLRDVSNVSGACVMIRRQAIKQCGYFDSDFFAYFEETDLFSRFRRQGWRVVFDPKVIIWHKMGASTRNKKYMYNYLMLKNQFFFAYKNFDTKYLKLYKKTYFRHVRRSFLVYLKSRGKFDKDNIIHKARVHALVKIAASYLSLRKARREVFKSNPNFSLNDHLFTDNPLPMSVFVDATGCTKAQLKILSHNLEGIASSPIKPSEIIVVSKIKVPIKETERLLRYTNVIDKGLFSMSPLDFFFMTSNNDCLLFSGSSLLQRRLTDGELKVHQSYLKSLYTRWTSSEVFAVVGSTAGRTRLNLTTLLKDAYDIQALRKSALTNHIAEQTHISTISNNTLTDVIGRCVAQGLPVHLTPTSDIYALQRGDLDLTYEPILSKPILWRIKQTLTDLHLWSISSKILKKLTRENSHNNEAADTNPVAPDLEYSSSIPVIINSRDRYEPLMQLIQWLEKLGHSRILLVDNDSTYPPLVDFFNSTQYQVISLGRNGMHKAPWESMAVRFAAKDEPYILSDPDILPSEQYPKNPIEYFCDLLNTYNDINKVGFGLRIDDLPDSYLQKQDVINWESRYWSKDLKLQPNIYKASLDTTFALYRPHTWWFLDPSIRTGAPYFAQHEPWYQSSKEPTDDFAYYRMRASRDVSTWGFDSLPKHHMRALKKEGFVNEIIDEEDE